jgi:hypothetical protein
MNETYDWGHGSAPFRDEILSSWSNRLLSLRKLRSDRPDMPLQMDYRGRKRSWVSASVNPTDKRIRQAAKRTGQPARVLASLALGRQHPELPWHWYNWKSPPVYAGRIPIKNPSLLWSWCSRCLAEDYASYRPAYIRVMSAAGAPPWHWLGDHGPAALAPAWNRPGFSARNTGGCVPSVERSARWIP